MNKTIIISLLGMLALILVASYVSALDIVSLDTSPNEIQPGGDSSISIKLENNDNFDLQDISASLNLAGLPFTSSLSQKTLDSLNEDKSKTITLEVSALPNAKSGVYNIPITVTSRIGNTSLPIKQINAVITVNSKPVIEAVAEDGLILKGNNNEIKIKIINKGLSDVKFLEVEISSGSYTLLSPSKAYIGDIDSNDFDSASFSIFVKENAGSTLSLPVTLIYKDITNKAYTEQQIVSVKVYSQQEAYDLGLLKKSNVGLIIGLIVVVIVLYLIYRYVRKYLKKRKAERAKSE